MFVTVTEKWVCQQGESVMCKLCVCNSDFENGRTDGGTGLLLEVLSDLKIFINVLILVFTTLLYNK